MSSAVYKIPESVIEDTLNYRREVEKFLSGEMSETAFRAARVPIGIYEQRESGTYMVRVRGAAGIFLPHQLQAVAELSQEFGNGILHITTRQDIQIHRVSVENTPAVVERLLEVGLASRGGGGNTVRNVSSCPYAGVCVDEVFDVAPYAVALTEYLIDNRANFNLPRKFKIAFSGCGKDCALASVADVGFFAKEKDGKKGFTVYAGGGMGAHSSLGIMIEEFIPAEDIFKTAEAVRNLFDKYGDRANRHQARLRYVLERVGTDEFRRLYKQELEELNGLSVINNQPLITSHQPSTPGPGAESPKVDNDPEYLKWYLKNVLPLKQESRFTVRILLSLGDITAQSLYALARLAGTVGDGTLRTTQDQDLQLRHISGSELPGIYQALKSIDPEFVKMPSVRTVACAGASTCKLGLCLSRNLAAEIKKELGDLELPFDSPLRISGCPNSCGQHPVAPLGLFGSAMRKDGRLVPLYAITVGGRMSEGNAQLARQITRVPARVIPTLLKEFYTAVLENLQPGEAFEDLMERWGAEYLKNLGSKYGNIPSYQEAPEYYRDFGADEDFTLSGRGPGECGAGVMDVIRLEIDVARRSLKEDKLYDAIVSASRALLVIRGLEPKTDREVFEAFREQFIKTGWIRKSAENTLNSAMDYKMGDRDSLDDIRDEITALIERVEQLFKSLDSSLNFRTEPEETGEVNKDTTDEEESVQELDLRGVACPMNFVRAKLQLEQIKTGEVLDILLDDGEPARNVPASFADQGEEVLSVTREGSHFRVKVQRVSE